MKLILMFICVCGLPLLAFCQDAGTDPVAQISSPASVVTEKASDSVAAQPQSAGSDSNGVATAPDADAQDPTSTEKVDAPAKAAASDSAEESFPEEAATAEVAPGSPLEISELLEASEAAQLAPAEAQPEPRSPTPEVAQNAAQESTNETTGENPSPRIAGPKLDSTAPVAKVNAPAPVPPKPWLNDIPTNVLLGTVLVTLAIASLVGQWLRNQPSESVNPALVRRFRQRLSAWWLMCAILVFGLLLGPSGTIILFGLVSFWALREFITMAPTRRGDHRALFWALIIFTPLQYLLIGLSHAGLRWSNGRPIDFYGFYSIMIPVYASLYVPARIAISGDHKRFLERSAQITVGLLICVYSLSYAPALLDLRLTNSTGKPWNGSVAGLLFFFILVSQLSDILQWSWGRLVGKKLIAAEISTSRTWEGFAGGTLSTGLLGAMLCWATPFTFWEAACMSMVVSLMGMCGGMTMSAIKRDRGVTDYGSLVLGHAGVLDRIDTLCFAAPVFYHLTRFFFSSPQ